MVSGTLLFRKIHPSRVQPASIHTTQRLQTLDEIRADILAVEKPTEGQWGEIIAGGRA